MFDNLDDSRFDGVAATYGPATEAPQRFRLLANADPAVSAQALYWIEADYFHQGLYCDATPLAVPYLLEVAQLELPVQAAVVRLLGEMLRGGADASNDLAAYAPAELDHVAVPATRAAVEAGAAVLAHLLLAPDPLVRCAAMWTNAGLGPSARAPIMERLHLEPDARVRMCGWIALSTLGELPAPALAPTDVTEADVLHVLGASSPIDDAAADAFVRLLSAPQLTWLPFAEGNANTIALYHLHRLGRAEPRRVSILKRAIESGRSSDEIDAQFRTAVFPNGVPHSARELNEMQRWAFAQVWVGEARGIELYYGDLAGQLEFVTGDGPLDDVVAVGARTCTVAEHLLAQLDDVGTVLAQLVRALPEPRVFDLAIALTRGDLGDPNPLLDAVVRACGNTVTLERTLRYLAAPDSPMLLQHAHLLLSPYFTRGLPSPESLDSLALVFLREETATLSDWLRTFSPQRRAKLVAPLHRVELWPLCDADALGTEVLDLFLARPVGKHAPPLYEVSSSILRARIPSIPDPDQRAQLGLVLDERAARTSLSLSARKIFTMTLEVMLPNGTRLARLDVDQARTSADLDPIRAVLRDSPFAVFTIYPKDVPAWIADALLTELGARATLA